MLDLGGSETFWLNVTNALLGVATLGVLLALAVGVVYGLVRRAHGHHA